jgi:alditol oxidase
MTLTDAARRNWAGNYTYTAPVLHEATSIEEVQRVVASTERVRALGTRHSFTDLPDTEGTLLSVLGIDSDFVLDEDARTLTLGAGTRYGEVALFLEARGWALHNMGSLPHISVGGAISTGTHGSGNTNGNLATAVRALTFVSADGSLREVRHGEKDFPGSVVGLGALGVLVRVTLAIEPTYLVRQDVYRGLAWEDLLADVPAVTGAGYSVSVFTDWAGDRIGQVWVKQRVEGADQPVPDEWFGAQRETSGKAQIIESAEDNTTQLGVAGAWSERLPHFRLDATPSQGDEIQTEYFVAASDAADALRAVKALGDRIRPHLLITELRTIAADSLWLSPAAERHSLAIHFTWRNTQDAVRQVLPDIEAALRPFQPRPHWGKLHTMTAADIAPQYPRMDAMLDLIARVDPTAKFRSAHLARVLPVR